MNQTGPNFLRWAPALQTSDLKAGVYDVGTRLRDPPAHAKNIRIYTIIEYESLS